MRLRLEAKKYHNWFWLRHIHRVRIDKCCVGCLIGPKDNRVYEATRFRDGSTVDIEVKEDPKAIAYYLCGISAGAKLENNSHVAFIPAKGERVEVEDDQMRLVITDARRIPFNDYVPNPPGEFTEKQRTCRNWIFANYVKDGLLEEANK